mmetsp:Transcript_6552/g.10712  ORF Transcript_6552/g.10712 Transcript_6552/m.10712 type:complete len:88 (-) Transcript_6552:141-404(-)
MTMQRLSKNVCKRMQKSPSQSSTTSNLSENYVLWMPIDPSTTSSQTSRFTLTMPMRIESFDVLIMKDRSICTVLYCVVSCAIDICVE